MGRVGRLEGTGQCGIREVAVCCLTMLGTGLTMPGTGARCCGQGRMEGVEWVLWLISEAICAACSSAGRTCCTMRPAAWSNWSWSWGDGWLFLRLLEIQQNKFLVYAVMNDAGMLYPHSFRAAIKSSSLATFFTLPASATILEWGKRFGRSFRGTVSPNR